MSLSSDLKKIAQRRKGHLKLIVERSLGQVGNSIIMNSAVKEGTFRGNWNSSIGGVDKTIDENAKDKSGQVSIGKLHTELTSLDVGKSFYFTNSLPYGEVLEYGGYSPGPMVTDEGYSKKSPDGMVGISVQLFTSIVEKEVRKLR